MFYILSKTAGLLADPLGLVCALALLAVVLALFRRRRLAMAASALLLVFSLGVSFTNIGAVMLAGLEDRFPRPAEPEHVDGIILLGGGFNASVSQLREHFEFNDAGDRIVEASRLAQKYASAVLVATGGVGSLSGAGDTDAVLVPRALADMGFITRRLLIEGEARNTYENAVKTREMIESIYAPGQTWLLVTSAFHMPRSMGVFRKAGLEIVPWPVDFRADGRTFWLKFDDPTGRAMQTGVAMKEWAGLLAYWLAGYTSELFPG